MRWGALHGICEIYAFQDVIILASLVNLYQKKRSRMIRTRYAPLPQIKMLRNACKMLAGCCLILVFCLSLSPVGRASAHGAGSVPHPPTLQVELGFQATYRIGFWTPVFITVNNTNNTSF